MTTQKTAIFLLHLEVILHVDATKHPGSEHIGWRGLTRTNTSYRHHNDGSWCPFPLSSQASSFVYNRHKSPWENPICFQESGLRNTTWTLQSTTICTTSFNINKLGNVRPETFTVNKYIQNNHDAVDRPRRLLWSYRVISLSFNYLGSRNTYVHALFFSTASVQNGFRFEYLYCSASYARIARGESRTVCSSSCKVSVIAVLI
jgi:hypothetical protein